MIIIPERIWATMLDEFSKEQRQVEQVCYFDGFRTPEQSVVTTLTLPNATIASGQFHVPAAAMSEAGGHFRLWGMHRIAQVHTHPMAWTGHSAWDDAKAYSQMPQAMSIVLPHFARNRPSLSDAGVHLRNEFGWTEIAKDNVSEFVRIVPSVLDFRPKHRLTNDGKDIRPARKRPWWTILAFWRD